MRKYWLAFCMPMVLAAFVTAGPNVPEAERIGGLISQLGSGSYRERLDAFRTLDTMGEVALEKLRLATRSPDTETAHRATELVKRIEHRVNSARILTATLVEVDFDDRLVPDAVREFQNKTGLPVALTGDTSRLGKRRVTYKSGRVTVWEALSGFCKAANLNEWNGLTPVPGLPAPNVATDVQANQIFMPQGRIRFQSSVRSSGNGTASQVFLFDESPAQLPTHQGGAVRVRALPVGTPIPNMTFDSDEMIIPLQVTLEPRLSWSGTPSIKIGHATDDREQRLVASVVNLSPNQQVDEGFMVMQMMGNGYGSIIPQRSQYVALRLQQGEKASKILKEIVGTLSLPLKVTGPIVVASEPMKAIGQTIRETNGSMTIHAIERTDKGEFKVDVGIELAPDVTLPMGNAFGNNRVALMPNVQVRVQNGVVVQNLNGGMQNLGAGTTEYMGLSLTDAAGKRLPAIQVAQQQMTNDPSGCKLRLNLVFKANKDDADLAQLTFTASHPAAVETEFRFADLPLP